MQKIVDILTGTKILERADSPINGKIEVMRDIAWGTYIKADGLTQSGGVVAGAWKTTLKKLKSENFGSCLILGLGGGSIAALVHKFWPKAAITGVDIDPIIVDMGKKYLGLDRVPVDIQIADAFSYCKKTKLKFDLILVDIYQGREFPKEFNSLEFLKMVKNIMSDDGISVFNMLFYGEKRIIAYRFLRLLEKTFVESDPVYPEANVMFVCKKRLALQARK